MKTILVVANDEVRKMIIERLMIIFKCTFSFVEASNGQQALLVLKKLASGKTPVTAVISEFKMSPLNGAGLVYQMNLQGYGEIPVFFLSDKYIADGIVLNHCKILINKAQNGKALFNDLFIALDPLTDQQPQD